MCLNKIFYNNNNGYYLKKEEKKEAFQSVLLLFLWCPIVDLNNLEKIIVALKKALRALWNVPRETHCRLIVLLSESTPLSVQLNTCFFKFMYEALEHDNSTIKYVTKLACQNHVDYEWKNFL